MNDETIIKNLKNIFKMIKENLKKFFNELKNKTNLTLFILIIASIVAFIVFAIIYNNSKKAPKTPEPEPTPTRTNDIDKDYPDDSATVRVYNKQLTSDVITFQSRLLSFRANNKNAVPYGEDTWKRFFREYLSFENEYTYKVCDYKQNNCKLPEQLTWENDKLVMYIANNAICKHNQIQAATDNGKVANYLHLRGETNGYYCISN